MCIAPYPAPDAGSGIRPKERLFAMRRPNHFGQINGIKNLNGLMHTHHLVKLLRRQYFHCLALGLKYLPWLAALATCIRAIGAGKFFWLQNRRMQRLAKPLGGGCFFWCLFLPRFEMCRRTNQRLESAGADVIPTGVVIVVCQTDENDLAVKPATADATIRLAGSDVMVIGEQACLIDSFRQD